MYPHSKFGFGDRHPYCLHDRHCNNCFHDDHDHYQQRTGRGSVVSAGKEGQEAVHEI